MIPNRDEPRNQGCNKCEGGTEGDWPTMITLSAGHACRDGCEHQDAFQALAEDENSNIQKSHR